MRGETRRKARRRIRRRSIAARIAAKTTGAAAQGAGVRPSPRAPRRTRPEVPSAACFAAASGAEPAKMRRVAQDCDPTAYMYTPRGRKDARIGHFSQASTVAAKQAARCQANQHCKHNTLAHNNTLYHQSNAKQIWYNSNTKGWKPESPVKSRRCRAAVKAGMRPPPTSSTLARGGKKKDEQTDSGGVCRHVARRIRRRDERDCDGRTASSRCRGLAHRQDPE